MTNRSKLLPGVMVFCEDHRPWWVIEWQPHNGDGCYWLTDAFGHSRTASDDELSMTPQNRHDNGTDARNAERSRLCLMACEDLSEDELIKAASSESSLYVWQK